MELFKHRHLAFGLVGFIVSLFVSYYLSTLFRVLVLVFMTLAFIGLFISLLIKKKKSMLDVLIKCTLLCFFVALSMLISLISFGKEAKIEKYYGQQKEVIATVKEEIYESGYESKYIVKIKEIDGKRARVKAILTLPNNLKLNDKVKLNATINGLDESEAFNEKKVYLDDGVVASLESEEYEIIKAGNNKEGIFKRLNTALCTVFERNLSNNSASIFKALLLGNTKNLDPSIRRDFSRIGISHILALSGMHITLITTLFGFLIGLVRIPKQLKITLIIISIAFFVTLTGFSPSCVRAGIMMCLFWSFALFGHQADNITSLLLSVSLMLLFSPYLIFSISLQLSFLAMLGCLVASKIAKKININRVIKIKAFRKILTVLFASILVIGFTSPVIAINFSSISLITPISNLIFVPVFTGLIYSAPFLFLVLLVPYVSDLAAWVVNNSIDLLLKFIRLIASIRGISMPIYAWAQYLGIIFIIVALIVLLLVKGKGIIAPICVVLCGFFILFSASLVNFIVKRTTSFVSTYSQNENDYILIEGKGRLSVIDVSKSSERNHVPAMLTENLGYTEIENYLLLDYSHKSDEYLNKVSEKTIIRNLYLPTPKNEDELRMNEKIREELKDERIKINELTPTLTLHGYKMEINPNDTLKRSERRCVTFSLERNDVTISYFGSGSYEMFDYYTKEKSITSDIIIFGAYGPTYKQSYFYEMNYLDYAIYMGKSYDFATEEHKNATQGKEFIKDGELIRIKIQAP